MVHTRHLPRSSSRGARRNFRGYPALVPMLVIALSSAAAFRGLPAGRPGASRVAPGVQRRRLGISRKCSFFAEAIFVMSILHFLIVEPFRIY